MAHYQWFPLVIRGHDHDPTLVVHHDPWRHWHVVVVVVVIIIVVLQGQGGLIDRYQLVLEQRTNRTLQLVQTFVFLFRFFFRRNTIFAEEMG